MLESHLGTDILQEYLEGNAPAQGTHMVMCDVRHGSTIRAEVIAETKMLSPPGRKWLSSESLA